MNRMQFKKIPVVTHYLELHKAPQKIVTLPKEVKCEEWKQVDTNEYIQLYSEVGGEWGWTGRLTISHQQLETILKSETNIIYRIYINNIVAGFFELNCADSKNIEIVYLGLVPNFIGKGYGKMLLNLAIENAWKLTKNGIVWLHTCEYDHINAMSTYLKSGFVLKSTKTEFQYYPVDFATKNTLHL